MLHPDQFQVNQAWILFQLNDAPIHIKADGDFNCLALMDAASCYILTSSFYPLSQGEFSELESRRILKQASEHKGALPKILYIPVEQKADSLARAAERQKIEVIRVPEEQLLIFIGEARQGFRERFGGAGKHS
ncbi:MAG: hypothetical protein CVU69_08180 [Deltaproteobacteria bacterium HGW-Deltaproteobacteria-4]|nr:MAG: hypothetical protein CVU69_08180 [Deltaproteobacteria bacterium HGW-Deltaproteobacteria-4]